MLDLPAPHAIGPHSVLVDVAGGDTVAQLVADARAMREAALAPRTRTEYAKNWKSFVDWTDTLERTRRAPSLPAHPALLGLYMA